MISISQPMLGAEVEELVLEVIRSGALVQGARVREFEEILASEVGVSDAIAVNNGTTALVLALRGIRELSRHQELKRSRVLTTPFTFVATVNAALEAGYDVEFVDIEPDGFLMDLDLLDSQVDERTAIILPVHLFGSCVDMVRVNDVGSQWGTKIVEDCAQAIGSSRGDVVAGSTGVGAFSFYATKNVATGEGGAITTTDGELADWLRTIRNQGMAARYEYRMIGGNYRMTDLSAAIGLPQLRCLDQITMQRSKNAQLLTELLSGLEGILLPIPVEGEVHSYHQYSIRVTSDCSVTRDELASLLLGGGISTGVYYPKPLGEYEVFAKHPKVHNADTPNALKRSREVLSLPIHPKLTESELFMVGKAVRDAVRSPVRR